MHRILLIFYISLITSASKAKEYVYSENLDTDTAFFGVSEFIARSSRQTEVYSPLGAYEMYSLISCLKEDDATEIIKLHTTINKLDIRKSYCSSGFLELGSDQKICLNNLSSQLFRLIHEAKDNDLVFDEYQNWIKESDINLRRISEYKDTQINDKSFLSYAYFVSDWVNVPNKRKSKKKNFKYQDGTSKKIEFMGMVDEIRHKEINLDNDKVLDIVVIPYDKSEKSFTQTLVYLIPKKHDCDLNELWRDFIKHTDSNFGRFIAHLPYRKMGFYVPKIKRLVTEFDLESILPQGTLTNNSGATMKTYLEIKEVSKQTKSKKNIYSHIPLKRTVKAKNSFLVFVYDQSIQSILLFMKYTGPSENK